MASLDQTFLLKLALSFLVGSIWITSVTVIAERFGSRIGGFIGGLPSTIVVALLFIGLTQSTRDASRAAVMIPLVMGVNSLFIVIYLARVHAGMIQAILTALLTWFLIIAGVILSGVESVLISFLVWSGSLVAGYYITEHGMHIGHKGGIRVAYTTPQIVVRGLISGLIISLAVLISRVSGPVIGGVASNFPVIFMSTLYITYRTGGAEFSRAVAKTLMISAMINVGVYSFFVHYAYLAFGLIPGTFLAMVVSVLSAMLTFRIIRKLTH